MQRDLTLKRPKFRPNVVVNEVMVGNPDFSMKSLSNGAKVLVDEEANEKIHDQLLSPEKEGQMFRNTSSDPANL